MKSIYKLIVLLMVSVFAMGLTSCATTDESVAPAAAVEVQPSADELERQRIEAEERRKAEELERMRQEELARQMMEEYSESTQTEAAVREMDFDPNSVLETVYYDYDKFDLKPETREALGRSADWVKSNPGYQIQIEGHCDERGSDEYNLALGERRASAAKNYLVSLGVDELSIFTISYGEEMPTDPRHNDDAWAQNRRAEFRVATP